MGVARGDEENENDEDKVNGDKVNRDKVNVDGLQLCVVTHNGAALNLEGYNW